MATRCCSPPESLPGRCPRRAARPNVVSSARPRSSAARRERAGDHLRQHDVFQRGELRQQMVELVDEADGVAADGGAGGVGQAAGIAALDEDRAAVRAVEQAGDMQQGGFAGAGGGHQRDDFACPHRQVGAAQHRQFAGVAAIGPA